MVALIVIWIIAALCGLAAASVWEPVLRLTLAVAESVDPYVADVVREVAMIGAGADTAIGWIVALAVGLPLTLLWLGFRMIGRLLRAPHDGARGEPRERTPIRPRADPGRRPLGSSVVVSRPRTRGDGSPTPDRATPGPVPAEAAIPRRVEPEPRRPASPPPDAPRWGRQ